MMCFFRGSHLFSVTSDAIGLPQNRLLLYLLIQSSIYKMSMYARLSETSTVMTVHIFTSLLMSHIDSRNYQRDIPCVASRNLSRREQWHFCQKGIVIALTWYRALIQFRDAESLYGRMPEEDFHWNGLTINHLISVARLFVLAPS